MVALHKSSVRARVGFTDVDGHNAVAVAEPITLEQRFAMIRYLVIEVLERRSADAMRHDAGTIHGWFGPWAVTVYLGPPGLQAILEVMDQVDARAADRIVETLPRARAALAEVEAILDLFRPRAPRHDLLERFGVVEVLERGTVSVTPDGLSAPAALRLIVTHGVACGLEIRRGMSWESLELEQLVALAEQGPALAELVRELGGLPPAGLRERLQPEPSTSAESDARPLRVANLEQLERVGAVEQLADGAVAVTPEGGLVRLVVRAAGGIVFEVQDAFGWITFERSDLELVVEQLPKLVTLARALEAGAA